MSEVKCRLCGGGTNEKTAICRVCALFRKDEVAALSEIRRGGIEKAAEKIKTAPCLTAGREEKTGGVKMAKGIRICSECGVGNGVRTAKCKNCGNAFPIKEKKNGRTGRKKREIASRQVGARNDKEKPAAKKAKGNGDYDGIMLKLINVKSDYQQKLSQIDNAIEVLKKYG